jgi:hypothetical protein
MINKIKIAIAGICILLATIAAWKVAKWKYQQEALQCKIEVADKQREIFTNNEKIIIKYKQVAEINRSRDIIELINEL